MKKFFISLFLSLSPIIQVLAERPYGPHGLDDSGGSSMSETGMVICFIIAVPLVILLIKTTWDDPIQKEDRGCLTTFLVGLLVIGFLCLLAMCS